MFRDEKATEEWPHTYRVAVKPKPKDHGSRLMTMGVGYATKSNCIFKAEIHR